MSEENNKGRSRRRQSFRDSLQSTAKKSASEAAMYSRQIDYDSLFDTIGKAGTNGVITLLRPPYLPGKLYEMYEQSSMLGACVGAYVDNVDGYGYEIKSQLSDDDNIQVETNPKVIELKNFFDGPNDVESFKTIREKMRRDFEVTGNSYLEVIRDRMGKPVMLFWLDARRMRVSCMRTPVTQKVELTRAGSKLEVDVEKRYRSYCMLSADGMSSGTKVRYFKQYGDPRVMDATTGEFKDSPAVEASEVIHFKMGNDIYGIPRWIGAMLSVMGSWKSNMVNYDLFENQGIPPMIISVAGGQLTDDSYADLVSLLRKAKGSQNFNKILILEAESNGGTIDGKDSVPHMDVMNMTEYRKEDAMFLSYMEYCNDDVQNRGFRLPAMFVGSSDDANYATAFIVRKTAEEQLFIPERTRFDEIINKTLVKDLGVEDLKFVSRGPVLQSTENIVQVLTLLVQSGVFTVNGLISFVNMQFGLDIALYEEDWADEPIANAAAAPVDPSQEEQPVDAPEDKTKPTDKTKPNAKDKKNETGKKPKSVQEEIAKNDIVSKAIEDISAALINGAKGCNCGADHARQ